MTFLLAFGCKSDSKKDQGSFSDCKYGQPEAVFAPDLPGVKAHRFEQKPKAAIENISLENGIDLQLTQSGCNEAIQEFRFQLPKTMLAQISGDSIDLSQPAFWISMAQAQFAALGTLGEKYMSFGFWAQAIEEKKPSMNLGEPVELQPGFTAKVDKIDGSEHTLLLVTLSGG
ncbi:MAG: hypothetical protein AAFO94_00265 [Bacteroidota bacterium]